ncbi:MAG TPA: DUF6370 family protein [Candidatus Polarisedimenticolaceae bacterium]|nr:DUF6370 family protein [Candidatus Polarisedimenticolaceae bacterium]
MKIVRLLLALVAIIGLASLTFAGDAKDVTVTGKLVCAKCALKVEGQKECQNVIVATVDGKETQYYVAKNKVAEEFGHVCKGEKNVVATGKVTQKDGKNWLDATKITQAS